MTIPQERTATAAELADEADRMERARAGQQLARHPARAGRARRPAGAVRRVLAAARPAVHPLLPAR
jgi:hypothetical protein